MMHMRPGSDGPAGTPRNTFSIFLYLVPVHCETREMPLLKCHKLFPWGVAWKQTSISFSPPSRHSVAHLMIWSFKTPLCNWCRRSGVKLENISEWGTSSQKGWFGCIPWCTTSAVSPRAASFIALRTLSTVHLTENWGWPCWPQATRHFGQRSLWQQAAKHCSGWSATYAARMGKTWQTKPSAHTMSTPCFPASMRGFRSDFMQLWKIWYPLYCRFSFEKHSSFVTRMYPIRTVACADGECRTDFSMFPMVR